MRKSTFSSIALLVAMTFLGACAHQGVRYDTQQNDIASGGYGHAMMASQPNKGTRDVVSAGEQAKTGFLAHANLDQPDDSVKVHRAMGTITHIRHGKVLNTQTIFNVKTTAGIDFTFAQTYGTAAQANGLNYIALSNDTVTETTASTTLSTEITANGLGRHIGTYAHTAGASTATISYTFTCSTAAQAAQKAALFSATSTGTMHHVLSFTQRSLQVGDQLAVTFTITLT
jgi:hypothetical protein